MALEDSVKAARDYVRKEFEQEIAELKQKNTKTEKDKNDLEEQLKQARKQLEKALADLSKEVFGAIVSWKLTEKSHWLRRNLSKGSIVLHR